MPEQRQEERLTVNREFNSLDAFIAEYVTNISRTGAFIRSKAPLPIGTKVNLEFNIIMDEGFETVRGIGEVIRTVDDNNESGMGVVFTELTEYSKQLIESLFIRRITPAQAAAREAASSGPEGAPSDSGSSEGS